MITNKELDAVKLSPVKQDYYQVWNELLDIAKKLSNRWDPTATNEADPGIVLLKVLTACADKLNYTIDKNILEAFMPSATQQESMRKLCDMLGYNMKYYRSAETTVTISYTGDPIENSLVLPKYFTKFKNTEEDINYVLIDNNVVFTKEVTAATCQAIEGELVEAEGGTIIDLTFLDDEHRYYLPETQVAENGIFIHSFENENDTWEKVDNLNTKVLNSKIFKFGYDSKTSAPYIQFPDDISSIIGNGLVIYYVRTRGIDGNISAKTLNSIELPEFSVANIEDDNPDSDKYTAENFVITNASAARNGANKETINEAYNGFKKTVGTFDTLVTCRDYMYKIYQLTEDDHNLTPLVSNIIVSDIRDDINNSYTLCSFEEGGLNYIDTVVKVGDTDKITHFDLILYPFRTYANTATEADYANSFTYSKANIEAIKRGIEENKTISHNIKVPAIDDIACIKVYLKLKAKITTTYKVNAAEEKDILNNIYAALYNEFNFRNIDIGEEIPFDSIYHCIQNADNRIKNVSLDEPDLEPKVCIVINEINGSKNEYSINDTAGYKLFNKITLRNILAGRISMFNYCTDFKPELTETTHSEYSDIIYPNDTTKILEKMTSSFTPENPTDGNPVELRANEVIKFRAKNYKTTVTYPAYVNYFVKLNIEKHTSVLPIAAKFITFNRFLTDGNNAKKLGNYVKNEPDILENIRFTTMPEDATIKNHICLYNPSTFDVITTVQLGVTYKWFKTGTSGLAPRATIQKVNQWLSSLDNHYLGLAIISDYTTPLAKGYLIDDNLNKFIAPVDVNKLTSKTFATILDNAYVQDIDADYYGLGKDGTAAGISNKAEYKLADGEYILFNWTDSTTDDSGNENKSVQNKYYGPGTIIRPTFENGSLVDSEEYHKLGNTYPKKSGFNFTNNEGINNPEGMFTLGTNDQIEIREPVVIELKSVNSDDIINLYWIRKDDEQKAENGKVTFDFDEDDNTAYTLKDGEYIFYTDKNKIDLAYYGKGTKIVKSANTKEIVKTLNSDISVDTIATEGLTASIPWVSLILVDNGAEVRHLELHEYQYINLIEKDKLFSIKFDSSEANKTLSNSWEKVEATGTTYKLSNTDESAAAISLPEISSGWEARSLLEFNMSPITVQTLYENDKIELYYEGSNSTTADKQIIGSDTAPVSLKTNYVCQASDDKVPTTGKINVGEEVSEITDFKVKVFKYNKLEPITGTTLSEGIGRGNKWTSIDLINTGNLLDLYTLIPTGNFGLLMFNAPDESTITLTGHGLNLSIFNKNSSTISNGLTLTSGINIVEIKNSSSSNSSETYITINNSTAIPDKTLIFGNLDVIKIGTELNPHLNYKAVDEDTPYEQLLVDILNLDPNHKFYYNCPIDNSIALDINTNETDEQSINYDDMTKAKLLYDKNNINNKFVVSEIDPKYLKTGITIAKTSKL